MPKKKSDNVQLSDWSLEVQCTGAGGSNVLSPCHHRFLLKRENILKRNYFSTNLQRFVKDFGFICPNCRCFTLIDKDLIPQKVKDSL